MSKPAFLEASGEEIAAWRSSAVTKAFLAWLDHEAGLAKDNIAVHVMEGRQGSARVLAGRLSAIGDIVRSCEVPAPLPEVVDEEFHDPAERRRPRHTNGDDNDL